MKTPVKKEAFAVSRVAAGEFLPEVKFDRGGLVPAIAQDYSSRDVLMFAFMDREALEKTLETGFAHYYSRSRKKLWKKGEESGHLQPLRSIRYDCDADAILLEVEQVGVACHTGKWSCFFREVDRGAPAVMPSGPRVLDELLKVLEGRKKADPKESYVASLYAGGLPKILAKVREEAGEFEEAAQKKEDLEVVKEFSDLLFHSLVLLAHKDIPMTAVYGELARRFGTSGHEEKRQRKAPATRGKSTPRAKARKRKG
ncbi:MAG: bifunctional phosphoribosyl-AMP cyclohydrolase/phosphoribosyl-ATP diphosphatase HisIE [Bdellovibrionota bacterium]